MKYFNPIVVGTLVLTQIIFPGCATMLQRGPDMVVVNTSPEDATIYLDGIPIGKTPTTVAVPRSSDGIFKIEKDGFKTILIDRDKVLAGWFFPGNLLWLLLWPAFPVAMIVDLATYNQGKYETTPIYLKLDKSDKKPGEDNYDDIF